MPRSKTLELLEMERLIFEQPVALGRSYIGGIKSKVEAMKNADN
jgi:hypothetical protein